MEEVHYLYLITRDDGELYVGVSKQPKRRAWEHYHHGCVGLRNQKFSMKILVEGSKEYIYSIEDAVITSYKASLNTSRGGLVPTMSLGGAKNPNAVLTEEQVVEILTTLKENNINQQILANYYGVNLSTICDIARGATWKEVGQREGLPPFRGTVKTDQDTIDTIIYLREQGLSGHSIGKKLGLSPGVIYRYIKNIQVDPSIDQTGKSGDRAKLTEDRLNKIYDLRREGLSYNKIASILGGCGKTVKKYCLLQGLE